MEIESKESYPDLINKIYSLGPIEKIVNDENIINQIIAYNGDRHLICAFFDRVNQGIKNGNIKPEDLNYLRSGKLMDSIINLEETLEKCGSAREPYTAERLDKINYISLIEDKETLAVSYTHPKIMDALCGKSYGDEHQDLTWWYGCGTFDSLPQEVQASIALTLLKTRGDESIATQVLEKASKNLTSYEEKNMTSGMKR